VSDTALARRLQWATVAWNSVEVGITIGLGIAAGSLALAGFGLDSLVEVFASLVVLRHLDADTSEADDRRAHRLVAAAFAVLSASLLAGAARALLVGDRPDESPWGIAYLAVTALVMFGLAAWKRRVGERLGSTPFLAEAAMTRLDGALSAGILTALVLNATLGWWWADPLAAGLIGAVAAHEAAENWSM
jgi:divalent metal cation (Fe/Co/Zn/Cd) transporter